MRVRVARIGKPFGLNGEVTVQGFTDEPKDRFEIGSALYTADHDSADTLTVDRARGLGERWTLGFTGVTDRSGAEALRGTELFALVDPGARPTAESGESEEWYDRQLVGLPAISAGGEALGEVVGVEHLPAHDLLVVRTVAGHDARVPFVAQIVTSVTDAGVTINAPAGLLDEN